MKIYIDGNEFAEQTVLAWEKSRVEPMKKILEKRLGEPCPAQTPDEFADYKMSIPPETMRKALEKATNGIAGVTKPIVRLSAGKRKISVAEIDVDFCDAKTLHALYFDMMLNNTAENLRCSLRANPEHFLVRGIDDVSQEVIEISGGIPLPERFIIRYGDESSIVTKHDEAYPYQAFGVSCLSGGLPIGAVRHQMKDTARGCHVKLLVEFPSLMPNRNIRAHQYHLACEFYNWFSEFARRV